MTGLIKFSPGDRVRVIDGTFVGLQGVVLERAEAESLWETNGGEQPPALVASGIVCVSLPIFERQVTVCLCVSQIEKLAD